MEKTFTIEMTLKVGQVVLCKKHKPIFGKYEIVGFEEGTYVRLKPLFKTDISALIAYAENVLPLW